MLFLYSPVAILDDIYEVCGSVPKVKTTLGHIPASLVTSLHSRDIEKYADESDIHGDRHVLDVQVLNGTVESFFFTSSDIVIHILSR